MGLFGDIPLRLIGVTGKVFTGKTLFGLSIDPNSKDMSGPARTLVFDDEFSSSTYQNVRNFDRIGIHEDERFAGKTGAEFWDAAIEFFDGLPSDKYDVIFLDTIEDWESSLEDWQRENPRGDHTNGQYDKMKGIFFNDMKSTLKEFIVSTVLPKCQVLAWSAHERRVWENERPHRTRTKAAGKQTWLQMAQLYLVLSQQVKPGAASIQTIPTGTIDVRLGGKMRLMGPGEKPLLPPTIEACTPDRIREYMQSPPNMKKLKKSEQALPEVELTEDEKLSMESSLAEDKRAAAEAALELERLRSEPDDPISRLEKDLEDPVVAEEPATAQVISTDEAGYLVELRQKMEKLIPGFGVQFDKRMCEKTTDGTSNPCRVCHEFYSDICDGMEQLIMRTQATVPNAK